MFRRIEFIIPGQAENAEDYPPFKVGLMLGSGSDEVVDAWIDELRGPTRSSLPANGSGSDSTRPPVVGRTGPEAG